MSLPLTHAGGSVDGISAALDLRFASSLSLTSTSGITPSFSRASTGTFFNASGVLTTAAINAPRFDHVYNGSSWVSKGLLVEEQRVNYVKYANDLSTNWTNEASATREYNSIASPDGSTNATKLNVAVADFSGIYQTPLLNAGSAKYTYSIFAKKGTKDWLWILNASGAPPGTFFNLANGTVGNVNSDFSASIVNCGNGWFRCVMTTVNTLTPTWFQLGFSDANNSVRPASTGYSYVYGAQIELGSFATSFIPNNSASSVTRSADVCQITGGDFSGFWNGSEGSFAVEFDRLAAVDAGWSGGYPRTVSVRNSSDDTRVINIFGSQSPAGEAFYVQDGTLQAWFSAGTFVAANTTGKFSAAYKINDFAATLNGAAVATDTSGVIPATLNMMTIGNETGVVRYINGHIARLRYFNKRLTNQQLEDLCKPEQQLKLDLNFSNSLSLTPTVGPTPSFSRASTGTYFNASGVLTSAAINAPRFDHVYNGSSWVSKGLLIEEQRTNVCLQSNTFNTTWATLDGAVIANAGTSPDGTNNAWKLTELAITTASHGIYQTITIPGGSCTLSIFAKAGERSWLQFVAYNSTTNYFTWFNLANGTIGTNAAGNTATITPVGNGWYRCSITRSAGSTYAQFYTANGDNNGSYLGEVGKGIYIYGAQVESGAFSTSYIPTTSSSATRSADVCQITGSDFSSFWNASEGSFACEVNPIGGNVISNQGIVTANDGTFANVMGQIRNLQNTVGDYGAFCRASGTTTMSTVRAAGSTQVGVTFQAATGFKANDCADSLNGGAVITDSTVTLPTVNRLTIGDFHTGANTSLNGHIARLRYYAIRLPNRLLIAKST